MKSLIRLATIDLAKGTSVLPWYLFFRRSLKWNTEKVYEYQCKRIQQLIQHSYNTVPYYHKILDDHKIIPSEIKSPLDLKMIPILDRDAIQNNQEELLSAKYHKKQLIHGSSSGTTGIPIHYYYDKRGLSAGTAAGYALWSMSGWKPGDRGVHIWGNATSIKQWRKLSSRLKNLVMRQLNIASMMIDDERQLIEISRKIIDHSPRIIDGYTSAIYTLASYFEKNYLSLDSLEQVITTAENLTDQQKELIEKVFAPTGDMYGCGEVLGIAIRPAREDRYFVLDAHVFLEVEPAKNVGMYNILATDLDNYGMPMIRYKIGDMIDDLHESSPENKYSLKWFKKIYGRSTDIVHLPNGMIFHPVNIFGGTLFRKYPGIIRHKVIWNGSTLQFVFECAGEIDKINLENELKALLSEYSVEYDIVYTDKILPSENGKYRYFENNSMQRKI